MLCELHFRMNALHSIKVNFVRLILLITLFGAVHNVAGRDCVLKFNSIKPVELVYKTFEPKNGIKEKTPIIFLHGITSSKENWADIPQIVADATNRKAYAIDARNHGASPWNDEFSFNLNAIDLENFMNQIKAEKVILIGHSMGGITSMKATLHWPNRIEKLVVEDMTPKDLPLKVIELITQYLEVLIKAMEKVPSGTSIKEAQKIISKEVFNTLPPAIKTLIKPSNDSKIPLKHNEDGSLSYKTNLKVVVEFLKELPRLCQGIRKGLFKGPALFIYGEDSPIHVDKDEDLIKGFFPKAHFIGIKNASHGVHTDSPAEYKEVLLKFLKN